ncbi:MAG: substrate-binding domain-containing protein, partial [Phycisphaeraceae bacterium]|nr:substrate-binding domain-containing protein [Phycisphaeraceae bacterium]
DMNSVIVKAYQHLVEKGCRRIALVCSNSMRGREFLSNYKGFSSYPPDMFDQLKTLGQGINEELIYGGCKTAKLGYQAMYELWHCDNRPDGIIISDDNTAMGVGQAVLDLQIQTPGQLKLVTQATAGVSRDFPIDFTRVQFDLARIGRGAFGLLYRLMLHERDADRLILKAAICQGRTT